MKRVHWAEFPLRCAMLTSLIFVAFFSFGAAADTWVNVLNGGFGDPGRSQTDALAIHNNYIYAGSATPLAGGGKQPHVFRASIFDDAVWEDFSPTWGADGEITGMVAFNDQLYVSTSGGTIWRLGADDVWSLLAPGWLDTKEILTLGIITPSGGESNLCAVRAGLEIWCGVDDTGWQGLSLPEALVDDASIASAKLEMFEGDLYMGIGSASAGSRPCELWKFASPRIVFGAIGGGWLSVTRDCFGNGSDLSWIVSMKAFVTPFISYLYIGTAGHGVDALVLRTAGRTAIDASPRDIYDFGVPFPHVPLRYGSMAIASGRLYVGTRTISMEHLGGDVISTNGRGWRFSNVPGFAVEWNDAITALSGQESYLYAGTINPLNGFEIWRRTPTAAESLPYVFEHYREMFRLGVILRQCLTPFDPGCPFDFRGLNEQLDLIELGISRPTFKNIQLQKGALAQISLVKDELFLSQTYAGLAGKAETNKEAQRLGIHASLQMENALQRTHKTLVRIKKDLDPAKK